MVDVGGQRAHLILTADLQTPGQIPLSFGQIKHRLIHLMERPEHIAMNQHHQQRDDAEIEHQDLPDGGDQLLAQLGLNGGITGLHQQSGHGVFLAAVVIDQIISPIGSGIGRHGCHGSNVPRRITGKPGHQLVLVDHQQSTQDIGRQLGLERCLDEGRFIIPQRAGQGELQPADGLFDQRTLFAVALRPDRVVVVSAKQHQ